MSAAKCWEKIHYQLFSNLPIFRGRASLIDRYLVLFRIVLVKKRKAKDTRDNCFEQGKNPPLLLRCLSCFGDTNITIVIILHFALGTASCAA